LQKLVGNIEAEEEVTQAKEEVPEDRSNQDNNEGWIDKRDNITKEDIEELKESVQPSHFLLTKVSEYANKQVLYSINKSLPHLRFANLHTQSKTPVCLSFLSGIAFLVPYYLMNK